MEGTGTGTPSSIFSKNIHGELQKEFGHYLKIILILQKMVFMDKSICNSNNDNVIYAGKYQSLSKNIKVFSVFLERLH